MINSTHQRIGVFVDVQNMYHSAKNLYRKNVNFAAVLESAVNSRQLIRALAYVVKSEAPKEKSFFEALDHAGFEVQSKDLQIFPGGVKKGDWDVGIAVDAITIGQRLDTVVLVTGDGDFIPLVRYLKLNLGLRVEMIAFGRSSSNKLVAEVDLMTNLDDDPERYLLTGGATRPAT